MFAPPPNVFAVTRTRADGSRVVQWYHQTHRNNPVKRGPLTRLPEPGTPQWHQALAQLDIAPRSKGARRETVAHLWELYSTGPSWPQTEGSRKAYQSVYLNHIAPAFGEHAIRSIKTSDCVRLRDRFLSHPSTWNMIRAVMVNMWARAIELDMVAENAPKGAGKLRLEPDSAKPLTQEAWAVLMSRDCPEHLHRFAVLARATGQRISDVVTFRPDMRDGDVIRHKIKKTKGRTKDAPHSSHIAPQYVTIIETWPSWPTRPYISMPGIEDVDGAIRAMMAKFAATEQGRALAGFSPHDLRSTCFCDDLIAGRNATQIGKDRRCSPAIVERYTQYITPRMIRERRLWTAAEMAQWSAGRNVEDARKSA